MRRTTHFPARFLLLEGSLTPRASLPGADAHPVLQNLLLRLDFGDADFHAELIEFLYVKWFRKLQLLFPFLLLFRVEKFE